MKKLSIVCLMVFGGVLPHCAASAVKGSCEAKADSVSMSASGAVRTVTLVEAYDEDGRLPADEVDPNAGVYYFKATLKRSIAYSVWTTGIGTNDTVQVSIYPEEPSESSSKDAPSADFTEVDEPNNDQRYILYADDWYIDPDDPSASDPTSWTYLIEVTGDVGESVTVNFQQGVVIPQGRPEAPLTISPSTTPARKLSSRASTRPRQRRKASGQNAPRRQAMKSSTES